MRISLGCDAVDPYDQGADCGGSLTDAVWDLGIGGPALSTFFKKRKSAFLAYSHVKVPCTRAVIVCAIALAPDGVK